MSFDIFNPQVSKIAYGLEGKVITIYGSNSLGKTKQAVRLKKPYYLGFERGLNGISGIPFLPINNWNDFKKVNKQLTNAKTLDQVKELYQTIIFDEVEASARYCSRYVCDKYEAETIAGGNGGFGLWKEYEVEYWEEINKLIGAGFTVIFIAHQTTDDKGKVWAKGDKRALAPIIDNSDIVVHLRSNGVDDKNKVIKSSGYMAETDQFFARSRFDYIDPFLPEFTAEALEAAIVEAIRKQEEAEGITAVSYDEQKVTLKTDELDFDSLKAQIIEAGTNLKAIGKVSMVSEIIQKHLGKGKMVGDFNKNHVKLMDVVLFELKEALKEVGETQE